MTSSRITLHLAVLHSSVIALLSVSVSAYENSTREVEQWSALSDKFETPHTKWARPYAGGTLRVPQQGMQTRAREAVELRQRLDISDLDAVYEYNFYGASWFGGTAGFRRIPRLLSKPYDVYVFQDLTPGKVLTWPDMPHEKLREAVRNGAGVVILGTDVNKYKDEPVDHFAEKQEVQPDDALLAGVPIEKAYRLGKGRIVEMPPRPVIPYRIGWETEYDLWQEKLVRAVLWAAGREPKTQLSIECENVLDRSSLPARVKLSWKGAPVTRSVSEGAARSLANASGYYVRLRRWDGEVAELGQATLSAADGNAEIQLPVVRSGRYTLEAFVKHEGAVHAWSVQPLEVTADTSIEAIEITSGKTLEFAHVEKNKEAQLASDGATGVFHPYFEAGESIVGRVQTTGPAKQVTVTLRDVRGRILKISRSAEFRFAVEPWMPMLMYVEAVVHEGRDVIAADYRYVRFPKRRRGKFNFVLWNYPGSETLGPYAAEQLKRMGVTAVYERGAGQSAAAHDMVWLPFTGGKVSSAKADRWLDPKYAQYWVNHVGRSASHGAFAYSLGDEGSTSGVGRDLLTATAYRKFLERDYGNIQALNRAWETEFKSFEEIDVFSGKQKLPPVATTAKLPSFTRQFDRFAFSGHNFVDMAKIHNAEMKAQRDPQAMIGFEGAGEFDRETDPESICRELGFWTPYAGHADELIRSIAPRSFSRGTWMGYHRNADGHLGRFYYALCNGCDTAWYWMWSTMGAWQGFQHPDLSGGPEPIEEFLKETQFVRDGLGDLLLRYEMQDDGIAMFYSRASVFLGGPHGQPFIKDSHGPYKWTHMTWSTAIQDLGMQYRYVTDRMLQRGEFDARRYRILILPTTTAMSPQAADVIRQFVRNGGTVIADCRPGLYDHHARPHDPNTGKGILDDLFGIAATLPDAVANARQHKIEGTIGEQTISAFSNDPKRETIVATNIKPRGAKALGRADGHPVCLVNKLGNGRAVLLNFALWSVMNARTETPNLSGQSVGDPIPHDVAVLLLELFKSAGIEPTYKVVPYKNPGKRQQLGNLEVQRWRNGDYEIVSLFRQTGIQGVGERHAQILPGREVHVYDINGKVNIGHLPEGWFWIYDIVPSRAGFYVVMPGECPAAKLESSKTARRGTVVRCRLSVPAARGLHALRVRVELPDGKRATWLEETVITAARPKEFVLPIAFNDPVGQWKLTVTDSFTPETEQRFEIQVE
jgi:beta-galactosidase